MTLLGLVVMRVDLGTKLLFLDDGLLLVFARLAEFLCRLVLELSVVHDLADRGLSLRGYFDEVEIGIRGDAERVLDAHDAHLLPAGSDQTDFRYADALVDAGLSADAASLVRSCGQTIRGHREQRRGIPSALCWIEQKRSTEQKGPAHSRAQADRSRLSPPAITAGRAPGGDRDRTVRPLVTRGRRWEWDSTCCPGSRRDGRAWESSSHDG